MNNIDRDARIYQAIADGKEPEIELSQEAVALVEAVTSEAALDAIVRLGAEIDTVELFHVASLLRARGIAVKPEVSKKKNRHDFTVYKFKLLSVELDFFVCPSKKTGDVRYIVVGGGGITPPEWLFEELVAEIQNSYQNTIVAGGSIGKKQEGAYLLDIGQLDDGIEVSRRYHHGRLRDAYDDIADED